MPEHSRALTVVAQPSAFEEDRSVLERVGHAERVLQDVVREVIRIAEAIRVTAIDVR